MLHFSSNMCISARWLIPDCEPGNVLVEAFVWQKYDIPSGGFAIIGESGTFRQEMAGCQWPRFFGELHVIIRVTGQ